MNGGATPADRWRQRVDAGDWDSVAAEVNSLGGALLPELLTPGEAAEIRKLYEQDQYFRSTIDMERYRFGAGQYRYFTVPYPEPVERLKQALYPRLLPIARDWAAKLGRPAPWPDTLDEWLRMCHDAGQGKPTAILLRYRTGDWNALHRDLYGDLVFPLQVVINLNEPGVDHTGGEFLLVEQRPRAQSRGTVTVVPHRRGYLFTTRDRPVSARLVGGPGQARGLGDPLGPAAHARPRLPRRTVTYTLLGADGRTYASAVKGRWGGHRRTKVYGHLGCPSALRAIAAGGYARHRVFFADEATAIAAGYRPCAVCCPDRYRAWKASRRC